MVREIVLTQGEVALVDDEDYANVSGYKWRVQYNRNMTYAVRHGKGMEPHKVYLHRQIMSPPIGVLIDHIDGNGLNNVKRNMRLCTKSQNGANVAARKNTASGLKGVTLCADRSKWVARLKLNRKTIILGYFLDPLDAARAYDAAAKEYFGEFARTNF